VRVIIFSPTPNQGNNNMFYVYEVLTSYGDLTIYGPFKSLSESKNETTDGRVRGVDGDKTIYTFVEVTSVGQKILGEVTFEDECMVDEGEDLRSENWKV